MNWFAGDAVVRVVYAFKDEAGEVSVEDAVDDVACFIAGGDEPGETEFGQVLADGGTVRPCRGEAHI